MPTMPKSGERCRFKLPKEIKVKTQSYYWAKPTYYPLCSERTHKMKLEILLHFLQSVTSKGFSKSRHIRNKNSCYKQYLLNISINTWNKKLRLWKYKHALCQTFNHFVWCSTILCYLCHDSAKFLISLTSRSQARIELSLATWSFLVNHFFLEVLRFLHFSVWRYMYFIGWWIRVICGSMKWIVKKCKN